MKKSILRTLIIALLICPLLSGCKSDPKYQEAKESYDSEVERIEKQIEEKNEQVKKATKLLAQKKVALDKSTETSLEKTIDSVNADDVKIPEMPKEIPEINEMVETLQKVDIKEDINELINAQNLLKDSRKQYEMLLNPTEGFLIERLKNVQNIDKIAAVTEDNDPNGNLNKPGGYTAQVYFSSPLVVDEYGTFTGDIIEDGTSCGGSVEVYKTVSEAKERNEYLANFDGSVLSSGSHAVYGSIVIRTSEELTATQQKELENSILTALTKLDK